MREIKFRAKSGTQWRYGDLYHNERGELVIYEPKTSGQTLDGVPFDGWRIKVDPESVGQYTGLNDRGGKEIFEGDIISLQGAYGSNATLVKWHDGMWCVKKDLPLCRCTAIASVIGNIHDNPGFLEKRP